MGGDFAGKDQGVGVEDTKFKETVVVRVVKLKKHMAHNYIDRETKLMVKAVPDYPPPTTKTHQPS